MRSLRPVLYETIRDLQRYSGPELSSPTAEFLCQVELGLYLQHQLMPDTPAAQAWVLFSGYKFARAYRMPLPPDADRTLKVARYSLWTLARRRAWREALERYQRLGAAMRGFDVAHADTAAVRQEVSVATDRWRAYDQLLMKAPPLAGKRMTAAGPGPHAFTVGRSLAVVDLPEVSPGPMVSHDVGEVPAGGGEPLTFRLTDLARTAARMDVVDRRHGKKKGTTWVERLRAFEMSTAQLGVFRRSDEFTVDGIQHLLGIVGAGKSTLRDIIAVYLAPRRRITVVVSDVAEVLKLVELYNRYTDGAAAPVLGSSGRERHAQRLHRRLAGRGENRLLAHDDPAFAYLGTSCVLNLKLRGDNGESLAFGESPCTRLRPPSDPRRRTERARTSEWQKENLACPYWSACPRHHGSRALVGAAIWVATLPSLIDSAPPYSQNGERIRYLELACRRSDLVIIDEADRCQMQLDQSFAPAVLLAADEERGLIDWLSRHKIRELAASGRTQLSDRDVAIFCAALNTIVAATDRLHAMLVAQYPLRRWVGRGYFSAWTLQLDILNERFRLPEDAAADHCHRASLEKLQKLLEAFRDNPFGDRVRRTEENFAHLTVLLNEVLHTGNPERTRDHLLTVVTSMLQLDDDTFMAEKEEEYQERLAVWQAKEEARRCGGRRAGKGKPPPQTPLQWRDSMAERFELTLLLSALEPRLALINAMWPRVEAALSLGFSEMYRRPNDYAPMVPEAPMGNVLGFQFVVHGEDGVGIRNGELTFFRCSGVGRELLRAMPALTDVDGRPGAHVLLMSGSSWAGDSSRYHIQVPVGVVIEPPEEVMKRIADESEMRFEFIDDGQGKLRVSGSDPDERPARLRRIATWLGAGADDVEDGGPLEREFLLLPPGRDQILLLVGSYQEARVVADTLHNLNRRWRDKVLCLVSDDEEFEEEEDEEAPSAQRARTLRRGDIERLRDRQADILVAPLLSVERGHNILNRQDEAAIGIVYFLARPNPHPDDLSLAVHAVNDWIVRSGEDGRFDNWVRGGSSLEAGAQAVRREARECWYRVLQRSMAWSRLDKDKDRPQVTWDILVLMWQVIGRLVRGGVPARVVFVDAAFAPNRASYPPTADTAKSSLLHSILTVLDPYFHDGATPADEEFIVRALYQPLWSMLGRCLTQPAAAA
ncbi:hypothetical protein [Streptomyces sp. NPDC127033]|uniref:pPIWI_RE_Z domain-containing protein n=1 Tax=Streptomyces sp. NPDC127033 TaxID=3347110 RepID=UPI003662F68D